MPKEPYASVAEYKSRMRLRSVQFDGVADADIYRELVGASQYIDRVTLCEFQVPTQQEVRRFSTPVPASEIWKRPPSYGGHLGEYSLHIPCPMVDLERQANDGWELVSDTDASLGVSSTAMTASDLQSPPRDFWHDETALVHGDGSTYRIYVAIDQFYDEDGNPTNMLRVNPAELRVVLHNVHEDSQTVFDGSQLEPLGYSNSTFYYALCGSRGQEFAFTPKYSFYLTLEKREEVAENERQRDAIDPQVAVFTSGWLAQPGTSADNAVANAYLAPAPSEEASYGLGFKTDLSGAGALQLNARGQDPYVIYVKAYWGWPTTPEPIKTACIEHAAMNRVEGPHATSEISPITGLRREPAYLAKNLFVKYLKAYVQTTMPVSGARVRNGLWLCERLND